MLHSSFARHNSKRSKKGARYYRCARQAALAVIAGPILGTAAGAGDVAENPTPCSKHAMSFTAAQQNITAHEPAAFEQ
jgi:hypothetical protein